MLDSIYVGMTGLLGYSQGLRVIANNTTNIDTPGFKSSSVQFADLFYSGANLAGGESGHQQGQIGYGLNTLGTTLSFKQGELRQSANGLDLAVDGQGMFLLRDVAGKISYTRAGQFDFDSDGILVSKGTRLNVMGLDSSGNLSEISIAGNRTIAGEATKTITFSGNLSSTEASKTISAIKVTDALGATHVLDVVLTNDSTNVAGGWKVSLMDGTTTVGTGAIVFSNGTPAADSAKVNISYLPTGAAPMPMTLDFSSDVTSFASGSLSTIAVNKLDGVGPGALTGVSFDAKGMLTLSYSNAKKTQGVKLALAQFNSLDDVRALGNNQFMDTGSHTWTMGTAGTEGFGSVHGNTVEISNVDLSQEFSDLVVVQRGYQASSQIVTTANEMLQELFTMKSK